MAISTYSELQTAVANWLVRSDLTDRIPEFISICESDLNNKLRAKDMISTETINPSTIYEYVALPDGFLRNISFTDDLGYELKQQQLVLIESYRYSAGPGRPECYALTSQIEFECVADIVYDYSMTYYKRLDLATDLTNNILTKYPQLYLYGTLRCAIPFLKDDKRVGLWDNYYQEQLKFVNGQETNDDVKLLTDYPSTYNGFDINKGY